MLVALANAQVAPGCVAIEPSGPSAPVPAAPEGGGELFTSWQQALLAGGFAPPDQYQAPALGGALTVAGWYKSTRAAVVLTTPSPEHAAALLDKGFTVVDMSDPAHWSAQFRKYPHIFGGTT